jgi:hypothetical protein
MIVLTVQYTLYIDGKLFSVPLTKKFRIPQEWDNPKTSWERLIQAGEAIISTAAKEITPPKPCSLSYIDLVENGDEKRRIRRSHENVPLWKSGKVPLTDTEVTIDLYFSTVVVEVSNTRPQPVPATASHTPLSQLLLSSADEKKRASSVPSPSPNDETKKKASESPPSPSPVDEKNVPLPPSPPISRDNNKNKRKHVSFISVTEPQPVQPRNKKQQKRSNTYENSFYWTLQKLVTKYGDVPGFAKQNSRRTSQLAEQMKSHPFVTSSENPQLTRFKTVSYTIHPETDEKKVPISGTLDIYTLTAEMKEKINSAGGVKCFCEIGVMANDVTPLLQNSKNTVIILNTIVPGINIPKDDKNVCLPIDMWLAWLRHGRSPQPSIGYYAQRTLESAFDIKATDHCDKCKAIHDSMKLVRNPSNDDDTEHPPLPPPSSLDQKRDVSPPPPSPVQPPSQPPPQPLPLHADAPMSSASILSSENNELAACERDVALAKSTLQFLHKLKERRTELLKLQEEIQRINKELGRC